MGCGKLACGVTLKVLLAVTAAAGKLTATELSAKAVLPPLAVTLAEATLAKLTVAPSLDTLSKAAKLAAVAPVLSLALGAA